VEDASGKQPREGAGGQVLGDPGGFTNLSRRQPIRMLMEQSDNDAPAFLHRGVDAPVVGRRAENLDVFTLLHHDVLCRDTHVASTRRVRMYARDVERQSESLPAVRASLLMPTKRVRLRFYSRPLSSQALMTRSASPRPGA